MSTDEMLRSPGPWMLITGIFCLAMAVGVTAASHGNAPAWLYATAVLLIVGLGMWAWRQWVQDHPLEATDEDDLE